MNTLADALTKIAEDCKDEIWAKSRIYCLVDIGKVLEEMGVRDDVSLYHDVNAVVPLKRPLDGICAEVNGRDLANYCQLETGIAVPEWVAANSELTHQPYEPNNRMLLSFA